MHSLRALVMSVTLLGPLVISGCSTLPENVARPVSHAYSDTHDTYFGKVRRVELVTHPGQSGFLLLASGLDAFVARALLGKKAERSLDVQYYLYHGDLTGILLIAQLVEAADRGVRVRLLIDDMDLAGKDFGLRVLNSHPNLEVRVFNPFSRNTARSLQLVTRFGSVTRRMHNKSFTADNQVTIVGGRNIGNEYFEADPDLAFSDLDVLALGPVVKGVSASFDLYWNSDLVYPISALMPEPLGSQEIAEGWQWLEDFVAEHSDSEYLRALRNSDLTKKLRADSVRLHWGNAEVFSDRPEKIVHERDRTDLHLADKLGPHLDSPRNELIIFSPYFVPGKEGVDSLARISERGVRVRILTNSLASTDVAVVHAGYAKYRKDLLRAGIELYEMNDVLTKEQRKEKKGTGGSSKASLHAKSFVLDRERVFIGSVNLDPRSIYENTEIGILLESPEIANGMGEWFDQNIHDIAFRLELKTNDQGGENILWYGLEDGKERVFTVDPYTGFWRRMGVGFMGILPIESQL